jgi:carnitine O-palmitoyltransferase 1, liver isoform
MITMMFTNRFTIQYLRSVRPLLDDSNYGRMEKLAEEFKAGIGKKLQWYLVLKSWWTTNYVSDWWEEYVYLRGRGPLMVNSNFYGIDAIMMCPTTNQAARAASVVNLLLNFRRSVERQELEPVSVLSLIDCKQYVYYILLQILVQGLVPLCSWQYERIFNTVRMAGIESDRIVHHPVSAYFSIYFSSHLDKMFFLFVRTQITLWFYTKAVTIKLSFITMAEF